jgi:23S rRNA (cytidine1920-2'-O)/16S rRNA (cytidine1409-2'-O)-methyltransferase
LAPSRERARADIAAGRVTVGGAPAEKPSRLVAPEEPLRVSGEGPRFVSRGGEKLDAALDRFGIDVSGQTAIDVGASTGGFTDCLLQRGASHVVAVDVGRGQLDQRLREDGRVTVLERTNVRNLAPANLDGQRFPIVTADLSFISLRTVAPNLVALAAPDADLVVLVKPQFEAGRAEVSRGRGVIRDPAVWDRAVAGVAGAFAGEGSDMIDTMRSPLTGADGNVEFLMHLRGRG